MVASLPLRHSRSLSAAVLSGCLCACRHSLKSLFIFRLRVCVQIVCISFTVCCKTHVPRMLFYFQMPVKGLLRLSASGHDLLRQSSEFFTLEFSIATHCEKGASRSERQLVTTWVVWCLCQIYHALELSRPLQNSDGSVPSRIKDTMGEVTQDLFM